MKPLFALLPSFVKGFIGVIVFLISIGWGAFMSVHLIVKAEGKDIRKEVKELRKVDMNHIDKRFDTLERLIKER